jgi:hypothetical protein
VVILDFDIVHFHRGTPITRVDFDVFGINLSNPEETAFGNARV